MAKIYRFAAFLICIGLMATFLGCAATRTNENTRRHIVNPTMSTNIKDTKLNDAMLNRFQIGGKSFTGELQTRGFINYPEAAARSEIFASNVNDVMPLKK